MMLSYNFIYFHWILQFLTFIAASSKNFCGILVSFKFQKFWSRNTKAMAKHKKVNIAGTYNTMAKQDSRWCQVIISSTFIEFCNFSLSLLPFQKFSAAFKSLLNFRNFGLVIQKSWQTIKKSISQLPTTEWLKKVFFCFYNLSSFLF